MRSRAPFDAALHRPKAKPRPEGPPDNNDLLGTQLSSPVGILSPFFGGTIIL